ncbi:MAG: hypothetical protein IJ424_05920 [Oscillospiraceae bacterium]|nr:hypothetical protein [Oscillospiraceae bacterium]
MKVLIISHLPMATKNNIGKTLLSLFSEFRKEELCQLYIYPTIPDVDRCSSYYRVTDKEALLSLIKFKEPGKEIAKKLINKDQGLYENADDESLYRNKKNKSALRRLMRDAVWQVSNWYNSGLKAWLEREKPTCIFVAPGAARFVYNFALKISKKLGIPIITYICDEYYFVKDPTTLLEGFRLKLLKNKIEALVNNSSHLVVICEELKSAYTEKFGTQATTLMTGTSYEISDSLKIVDDPKDICYFGNIRCNRYISLAEIGRQLDGINAELNKDYKLKIYTSEKDKEILSTFDGIRSVKLCGFVMGEAFKKAFSESHLLLHIEAFDEKSIDYVKHSVSTKIADSLASGIPLLAYGPECVSSMKHLIRNKCAITAISEKDLRQMLLKAFNDIEAKDLAVKNALAVAKEYHNSKETSLKLKEIVKTVSK